MAEDPTQAEELAKLARDLGIDPSKDEHLVWALKDMDNTPLPEHWQAIKDDAGQRCYHNRKTMVTTYEHPSVSYYRQMLGRQLKPGIGESMARHEMTADSLRAEVQTDLVLERLRPKVQLEVEKKIGEHVPERLLAKQTDHITQDLTGKLSEMKKRRAPKAHIKVCRP